MFTNTGNGQSFFVGSRLIVAEDMEQAMRKFNAMDLPFHHFNRVERVPFYNIHHAINYRSWRKGYANDFLSVWKDPLNPPSPSLVACKVPCNGYMPFFNRSDAKSHSKYPYGGCFPEFENIID